MKFICKYCDKECKNLNSLHNHERVCKQNPNRAETALMRYNRSVHASSNQYIKAAQLGLPKPEVSDEVRRKISISTTKHNLARTDEINKKISETILEKSKNGTWHKSLAKNMHYNYNGIDLDGSWELNYAKWLDANNIKWERPSIRFTYKFKDKVHYYTPDFYLIETNEYVEVKGYKTAKDEAKWRDFPKEQKLKILFEKDLKELGIIS